ncbi:malectin domain-containing carbohydrate-binding protein [Hymenobacter sp. 5317J-9]|uniref:glycoside hydrolase family 2 TIM barrel-domain containing protein n=1 Tax=Hymenobacter sp. 5317J-9 TaxID=2932250 RepID=UPI001FD6CF28|nr:glycoside hydrolase family 2 TIM barrel-domain containing protein [Hymenobacter sp. 5317J-9]UOQ97013.1 malectin domain-containing carbohydrate-binding protein [Hymenobacter sp. 5317J-9]
MMFAPGWARAAGKLKSCFLIVWGACLLQLAAAGAVAAQGRVTQSLNADWRFCKGTAQVPPASAEWQKVSVPHTWNAADVLDDAPGYYRGVGWYRKTLHVPAAWQSRSLYLHFEGASQTAEVYVNGQLAGRHVGGYTAFSVPVGKLLRFDGAGLSANEVLVKVDNSPNPNIPPLSGDFSFYGGIYRDVYLVAANDVHFDLDNYGSGGVFVSTPGVSAAAAEVAVRGTVANDARAARTVRVTTRVLDRSGRTVARQQTRVKLAAGQRQEFRHALGSVPKPHLWSPDDPYLYRVVTTLGDDNARAATLDEVNNPLGMRWFRFDPNEGFFLNGQHLALAGASRHQDFQGLGNALPDALHERDVLLLKQMGGNFLRIAHYPQDPAVLAACDRLGVLAAEEIPVVNGITDSPEFFRTCETMQTEMIRQHFNHPSVIIWAYMNEVLLRLPDGATRENAAGQAYFKRVARLAQRLDSLTRREDPARYTMIVNHGAFDLYQRAGLTAIPMLVGWNLYAGWYSPKLEDFPAFMDQHHRELPTKPLLITEFGADADSRLHAFPGQRFDKTEEYAAQYHQFYLNAIRKRPFVAGAAVWNLVEFNAEQRQEANPHLNTKGLLTADRQPKAAYLYYQSQLLKTPFVRIGSRAWNLRSGTAAGPDSLFCAQPVEVYTNQPTVRLLLNGQELGTRPVVAGVARFRVPFRQGPNQLTAQVPGQALSDQAEIEFLLLPQQLTDARLPFTELNVSLGDQRYFTDAPLHQVWVPEQEYTPGRWGYVGGQAYVEPSNGRLPYGSGRNILGTEYDALYQTQRVGLRQFRLDVPDGQYEVTLHFAELETAPPAEQLAYNLDQRAAAKAAPTAGRSFDVWLNGQLVLPGLGADTYLSPLQATSFRLPASAQGGKGLVLDFKARTGMTILNGIQVKQQY